MCARSQAVVFSGLTDLGDSRPVDSCHEAGYVREPPEVGLRVTRDRVGEAHVSDYLIELGGLDLTGKAAVLKGPSELSR